MTIYLSGRIDSANAAEKEKEIFDQLGNERKYITIDGENLEYISSAGLRILLKIRKESPDLKIVNANSEVYDIFEMTGFTEMIPVTKAYKKYDVTDCKIIGQGAKGIVYRLNGDTIVKVYKNNDSLPDIQKERELAKKAFVLGVPTAISYDIGKVGDKFCSVFELLDCKSYSQEIKDDMANFDKYVKEYAELLKLIHSIKVKEGDMPSYREEKVFGWIKNATPYLPKDTAFKIYDMVSSCYDSRTMLHCDYHTNNVMRQNGEAILIDMDTLSYGNPIFELANIFVTYVGFGEVTPEFVEKFIGLPFETSKKIWEKFLPIYLGTDDVTEVENKAKLLGYTRYLSHTVRRDPNTEEAKKVIAHCQAKIEELINKVDSL